jgi:hypothetical protein
MNKKNIKIDIVVPSYINDFYCIVDCIKNLSEQTVKPNNIIICVSQINIEQKNKPITLEILESYNIV